MEGPALLLGEVLISWKANSAPDRPLPLLKPSWMLALPLLKSPCGCPSCCLNLGVPLPHHLSSV